MLILVLIPVASAMDSDDAFYEEYDYEDFEEVVVEYDNWEVDDTQIDTSSQSYDEGQEDHERIEDDFTEPVCESEDAVESPELNENSDFVTHDIDYASDEIADSKIALEAVDDSIMNNINETSNDELTLEDISVDVQGSIFISKVDISANVIVIDEIFKNEITTLSETTSFGKNLSKVIELKDTLLINHEIQGCSDSSAIDHSIEIKACIDKITNDFAYSIDNSISGDAIIYSVIFNKSSFLNIYPCFDAAFSRTFLHDEYFFGGDIFSAAEVFANDDFVEYINNSLSNRWIIPKKLSLPGVNLVIL